MWDIRYVDSECEIREYYYKLRTDYYEQKKLYITNQWICICIYIYIYISVFNYRCTMLYINKRYKQPL